MGVIYLEGKWCISSGEKVGSASQTMHIYLLTFLRFCPEKYAFNNTETCAIKG